MPDLAADLAAAAQPHVSLQFACTNGRTWLARQRASYPFHVGRTLSISGDPSRIATAYLQCCSGGLFEHDDVRVDIETQSGAAAHVGTSAATIVHSMRVAQAKQTIHLVAHAGSYLEYLPQSVILFPAARLLSSVQVRLHEGASLLVGEVVLAHDPEGQGLGFERFHSLLKVYTADEALAMRDRWLVDGAGWSQRLPGITGPHRVQATLFILHRGGLPSALLDRVRAALPEDPALYAGASRLPNDCGMMVRALSSDEPLLQAALLAVRNVARTVLLETGTVTQERGRTRLLRAG
jgi:urease accessory protein